MKSLNILFLLFTIALASSNAQESYFTDIRDKQIKSLQVKREGEMFANPFIQLNNGERIEINFDALNPGFGRYAYNLIHCDADWTRSSLSQIEYMDGFQGSIIDDFANAMGTTVQYTNYRLFFPNEDVRPKVSGNYALEVYNEDDPSHIVFTACFSISSTPLCKSQKKSSGRRLARPLRETYSPSYWHFPQPATDWLPLGSRPKRRIMINEYGSWPPSRHSLSAHSIRLPLSSLLCSGSWPGLLVRLSIHATYPLLI